MKGLRCAAGIILTAVAIVGCSSGPKVGSVAPGFNALDAEGRSVALSDYEGKPLVLYFWAVWCPPCVTSGPEIQRLHEEYRDNDVVVIGVHYDDNGDPRSYMNDHDYTFELIPNGNSVADVYGVTKIPQIIVIGRDGTILHRQIGFAEGDGDRIAAVLEDELAPR
ncbi:MAG: TlpA family protein disulfide reductase [Candidatus Latescibacterota bacterium]|nr:MAG: TlpA family protein disulfide reductase [Candidatus Latescibacterota bacterium]